MAERGDPSMSVSESTADELFTTLSRFHRLLRWGFRTAQQEGDPGPAAQMTLLFLRRQGPSRAKELALWLGIDKAPASRLVADLEAKGLLCRETDPDDARSQRLSLTEDGVELVLQLRARRVEVVRSSLTGLDDVTVHATVAAMEELMTTIQQNLSGDDDRTPPSRALRG